MSEKDKAAPRRDQIAIENVATWRVGRHGAIVCDCPEDCPDRKSDLDSEAFYGGHFVCESVGGPLADFIVAAVKTYSRLDEECARLRQSLTDRQT